MRPDKCRPMRGIPQDIFAVLWRAEKNAKSRKRSQAMVRRVIETLPPVSWSPGKYAADL